MTVKKKQLLPKQEPLFINFVNTPITMEYVGALLLKIEAAFSEPEDKKSVKMRQESLREHHIEGYKLVQTKLRDQLDFITDHGKFDKTFGAWANFYLSSLKEYRSETGNSSERYVRIGDPNGDWVGGLVIYNFSLFCKEYGFDILKKCPVDGVFFTMKGKYAKYCSDSCKNIGKTSNEAKI